MTDRAPFNVLFLCTGNSARSIMAECSLNRWAGGRFRGFSAGSHPRGQIHPMTLDILQKMNIKVDGLRSKSWEEFARPDSPRLDFVFTVCDQAAGETCPLWPGQPMTAYWGVEDPAAFVGSSAAQLQVFQRVYLALDNRIKLFTSLRLEELDKLTLQDRINEIGSIRLPSTEAS